MGTCLPPQSPQNNDQNREIRLENPEIKGKSRRKPPNMSAPDNNVRTKNEKSQKIGGNFRTNIPAELGQKRQPGLCDSVDHYVLLCVSINGL